MALSSAEVLQRIIRGRDQLVDHVNDQLPWSKVDEDVRRHLIARQLAHFDGVHSFVVTALKGFSLAELEQGTGRICLV